MHCPGVGDQGVGIAHRIGLVGAELVKVVVRAGVGIRGDFFHHHGPADAGGHGGQSVNTTDSAVRVTHIPTGISVAIQNERSQLQNKETAMTILRSRLAQLQIDQHKSTLADIKGPNTSAEWGSQFRNYVLHPYKQVKDSRSGYESSDPQAILDGKIDDLLEAYVSKNI